MLPTDLPRLDELEAKAAAATPGPWVAAGTGAGDEQFIKAVTEKGKSVTIADAWSYIGMPDEQFKHNAALIAAAPDAVRLSRALADALWDLKAKHSDALLLIRAASSYLAERTLLTVEDYREMADSRDAARALLEAVGYAPRGEAYKPKEEA